MLAISRPLQALLLATLVASVLSLLQPDFPAADADADLLAAPRPAAPGSTPAAPDSVATRTPVVPPALGDDGYALRPPPPPVFAPPPVARPTAPPPPFVYLGRMVREGEVVIFLGQGEEVETVTVGEDITEQWRLEAIEDRMLRLRYLPLDETRPLMTSR